MHNRLDTEETNIVELVIKFAVKRNQYYGNSDCFVSEFGEYLVQEVQGYSLRNKYCKLGFVKLS